MDAERPDFFRYQCSIASELDAVKYRIRHLVEHDQTDGEWKEAALRVVLRRHLPASSLICRGFIVAKERQSTQIDILVMKPNKPMLFYDGTLAIVTSDAPAAIIEVKTNVEGLRDWSKAARALAKNARLCKESVGKEPWLGLFAYDGSTTQADNILQAVRRVHRETGVAVNCVACGKGLFVRYWPRGEFEPGHDADIDRNRQFWRAYGLPDSAPSYFVANLLDAVCDIDQSGAVYAWAAYPGGKWQRAIQEMPIDEDAVGDAP